MANSNHSCGYDNTPFQLALPANTVPPFGASAFAGLHLAWRPMKECPLCGETMRLSIREIQDRVPGVGQTAVRVTREWICPECDYFEEAEAGEK